MMTQLEAARGGQITSAMEYAAAQEGVRPEALLADIARGHAVIPANPQHKSLKPAVVGRAYRTKVNANLGRSGDSSSLEEEIAKVTVAIDVGADFVMDLSVGDDLSTLRRELLKACAVPFGTVPVYEALSRVGGDADQLTADLLLDVISLQASEGVDFMTIHAGLLRRHVALALKRKMGIVSRGGSILAEWMCRHDKDNPFQARWDDIMACCRENDVTVSLGDALRPGCLADASDEAQFAELTELGSLVKRCRDAGVQVMVEGPGHVPFDQIQENMEREHEVCDGAPFYVLGPVVTDIAPGYDHITSCIGATEAAYHGASLLCYVTPAGHLSLPTSDDVRRGVIAYRIAAHAADIALHRPGARDADDAMAEARVDFNWERQFELAMDGETARKVYQDGRLASSGPEETDHCSMCGKDFCAVRTTKRMKAEQATADL